MRIIKEGKLPPKEKKMTCPECGCVFMYERQTYIQTNEKRPVPDMIKRVTDESWDYTLTVKVGHDHFGRPLLSCGTWPPTQAEAGVVRQMRDMLSSWLDNSSINN